MAAGYLSQEQATKKAVAYMGGDIYGESLQEILNEIKDVQFIPKDPRDCGPVTAPVWVFQIKARYNGRLCIDATSGETVYSSLPFLRQ